MGRGADEAVVINLMGELRPEMLSAAMSNLDLDVPMVSGVDVQSKIAGNQTTSGE